MITLHLSEPLETTRDLLSTMSDGKIIRSRNKYGKIVEKVLIYLVTGV